MWGYHLEEPKGNVSLIFVWTWKLFSFDTWGTVQWNIKIVMPYQKALLNADRLKICVSQGGLPHNVKTQYLHFRFHANYFSYLGRSEKLGDDQCSSWTKGSIYHINHMSIQPFTTVVDWPETWCLMEVSGMLYICGCCVFTWDGKSLLWYSYES